MIFYFTGTDNSLYVAKQLEQDLISIPQVFRQEPLEFTADTIGIVSPVYEHEVLHMVRDFLHNAVFHTNYFYMILTYGNRHGGAAKLVKLLCEECGIRVNYINVVQMVDNRLLSFDMNEQVQLDKQEDAKIVLIKEDLASAVSEPHPANAKGRPCAAFYPGHGYLRWLRHLPRGLPHRLHAASGRQGMPQTTARPA